MLHIIVATILGETLCLVTQGIYLYTMYWFYLCIIMWKLLFARFADLRMGLNVDEVVQLMN